MVKKRAKNEKLPARRAGSGPAPTKLLRNLRDLIQSTRTGLAQAVNSALVLLYWQVGQRIRSDVLKSRRATYGDEICSTLSNELAVEFGERLFAPQPNADDPLRGGVSQSGSGRDSLPVPVESCGSWGLGVLRSDLGGPGVRPREAQTPRSPE